MITTKVNTGKFKLPLKLRKPLPKINNYSGNLTEPNKEINTEELNDILEMVNDNYDTFKTIFTAQDDINVNHQIKQEAAGLLINLFKQDTDPMKVTQPKIPGDLASFISSGFDEEEYEKHNGNWDKKNISDFKQLFN